VTDYLPDIASDLSAFHGIDDAGEMEAAVFYMLAYRLPAYQGAMAAVVAQQRHGSSGTAPSASSWRGAPGPRYEARPAAPITPRTADQAPPATAATFAALNSQLGARWFAHRTVSTAEMGPADTRPGLRAGDA
jgi:hypothetical protein